MRTIAFFAFLALLFETACALQPSDPKVPLVTSPIKVELLGGEVLVCDRYNQVEKIFKAGRRSSTAMDEAYNKYASMENKNGSPICTIGVFSFQSPEHVGRVLGVHITDALVVCDIFKADFEGETAFLGICSLREEEIPDGVVVEVTPFSLLLTN